MTYAIAKTDSLFFEFLYEVYREALLGNKDYISIDDFENFFAAKKEIDSIIAKACRKRPSDRYQSSKEMLEAVKNAFENRDNFKEKKSLLKRIFGFK